MKLITLELISQRHLPTRCVHIVLIVGERSLHQNRDYSHSQCTPNLPLEIASLVMPQALLIDISVIMMLLTGYQVSSANQVLMAWAQSGIKTPRDDWNVSRASEGFPEAD